MTVTKMRFRFVERNAEKCRLNDNYCDKRQTRVSFTTEPNRGLNFFPTPWQQTSKQTIFPSLLSVCRVTNNLWQSRTLWNASPFVTNLALGSQNDSQRISANFSRWRQKKWNLPKGFYWDEEEKNLCMRHKHFLSFQHVFGLRYGKMLHTQRDKSLRRLLCRRCLN